MSGKKIGSRHVSIVALHFRTGYAIVYVTRLSTHVTPNKHNMFRCLARDFETKVKSGVLDKRKQYLCLIESYRLYNDLLFLKNARKNLFDIY